jgi:hypothetical protein
VAGLDRITDLARAERHARIGAAERDLLHAARGGREHLRQRDDAREPLDAVARGNDARVVAAQLRRGREVRARPAQLRVEADHAALDAHVVGQPARDCLERGLVRIEVEPA